MERRSTREKRRENEEWELGDGAAAAVVGSDSVSFVTGDAAADVVGGAGAGDDIGRGQAEEEIEEVIEVEIVEEEIGGETKEETIGEAIRPSMATRGREIRGETREETGEKTGEKIGVREEWTEIIHGGDDVKEGGCWASVRSLVSFFFVVLVLWNHLLFDLFFNGGQEEATGWRTHFLFIAKFKQNPNYLL
jgi:hypothetical protein